MAEGGKSSEIKISNAYNITPNINVWAPKSIKFVCEFLDMAVVMLICTFKLYRRSH